MKMGYGLVLRQPKAGKDNNLKKSNFIIQDGSDFESKIIRNPLPSAHRRVTLAHPAGFHMTCKSLFK